MTVEEFLESTFDELKDCNVRQPVKCVDGFSVSIQGGTEYHYCKPRTKCNIYYEVELGFPSKEITELNEYAETPEDHTNTVFAYVPIEKVERVIANHGGIAIQ